MSRWDDYTYRKSAKVHRRVRKGIPPLQRSASWAKFAQVDAYLKLFPGLYASLSSESALADTEGMSKSAKTIDVDLYRTFPTTDAFMKDTPEGEENLRRLRRILRAYAEYDEEVGYCQGMNFVVATLTVFQRDEEAAFWTFVTLMQQENEPLRELYLPDMRETSVVCGVLDHLVERHLPALAARPISTHLGHVELGA